MVIVNPDFTTELSVLKITEPFVIGTFVNLFETLPPILYCEGRALTFELTVLTEPVFVTNLLFLTVVISPDE